MSRILRLTFITLTILELVISCNLSPGSYPHAEVYEFDVNENKLIRVIQQVKIENPDIDLTYKVKIPNGGTVELQDEKKNHWYSFYLYYSDKDEIVHTWTRSKSNGTSQFAFVGSNKGLTLGNWINPNSKSIEEFDQRILTKIKAKLE